VPAATAMKGAGVAKKTARAKLRCQSCGTKMKKTWGGCPRCGRPRLARDVMGKAVGATAFLAKGARVRCATCGTASRPGASYCTGCGRPALTVVKSAFEAQRDDLMARIHQEANPEYREAWWEQLNKLMGGGGAA
jgi:predicted amidophosphoribosyltransferase